MTIKNRYGNSLSALKNAESRRAKLVGTIANNGSRLNALGDVVTFDIPRRAQSNDVTLYVAPGINVEYAMKRINKRLGTTLDLNGTETVKMSRIDVNITVKMGK